MAGRIFVANAVQFEGYTGGGGKDSVAGLIASGDVGHFDSAGRLFFDGRDDDMIVSGGENVFPAEVEEALAGHPGILEAAAIGVADDDYGQRLRCFVVAREGALLTEQQVKDYVKAHLARFKAPRDVRFVAALPRNPTGKVLKHELAESTSHDELGLSASVWTTDRARGERVARQLQVGADNVSDALINLFSFALPMGGWKQPGLGTRWGGVAGLRTYPGDHHVAPAATPVRDHLIPYSVARMCLILGSLRAVSSRGRRRWVMGIKWHRPYEHSISRASESTLWSKRSSSGRRHAPSVKPLIDDE